MPVSHDAISITATSLSGISVLSDIPGAARDAVAARCAGQRYQPQAQIVSHQEPSADVYFIISGSVRITFYSNTGKEITFRDMHAGAMFGELSAIDGAGRSAYVVALTEATVATMTRSAYLQTLEEHPDVAMATLRHLTKLVRALSDRVVEFSTLGVKNRIHAELLRLAIEHGTEENEAVITPAPKHADIASRVSTHREAVTRELNKLSRKGLLARRSNTLLVKDVSALETLVREVADA